MKNMLDKSKQSIESNKYEHPTITLTKTFHKNLGGANPYVHFGCVPQTIFNITQGKISVSMNADPINANKQVNNKRHKYDN